MVTLLDPNIFIPSIIGIHILGVIAFFVLTLTLDKKGMVPPSMGDWVIVGGTLAIMSGIFAPVIFWFTLKNERKKYGR